MTSRSVSFSILVSISLLTGCDRKSEQPSNPSAVTPKPEVTAPKSPIDGHTGELIELGETTLEGIKIKATRDKGDIKPGGDAPIDVWLNGGLGDAGAVRFWIGTEDAKGSVKAKADVEAGHWHTHAEVPEPLPADSKLWVEIESKDGRKHTTSFPLKM